METEASCALTERAEITTRLEGNSMLTVGSVNHVFLLDEVLNKQPTEGPDREWAESQWVSSCRMS